jgi:hypothetical protein
VERQRLSPRLVDGSDGAADRPQRIVDGHEPLRVGGRREVLREATQCAGNSVVDVAPCPAVLMYRGAQHRDMSGDMMLVAETSRIAAAFIAHRPEVYRHRADIRIYRRRSRGLRCQALNDNVAGMQIIVESLVLYEEMEDLEEISRELCSHARR